jgi:hypothetical protein
MNWQSRLWETLAFFRCQNIKAPNPILHTPRLIRRTLLHSIPENWNRNRLLFEPTYLLWNWHQAGFQTEIAKNYRKSVFSGDIPSIESLQSDGYTILNWGKKINHQTAQLEFDKFYSTKFD